MLKFHLINAVSNPIFKDLKIFVKEGSNKNYPDLFCVSGLKNNLVALENKWKPHSIFLSTKIDPKILNQIKALTKDLKIRWIQISESLANILNGFGNGLDLFFYYDKKDLIKQSFVFDKHFNYALCDNVQDPSNLGSIIRNASAFNIKAIFLINSAVSLWNPKVVRASAGTIFSMNFSLISDEALFFESIKDKKMILISTINSPKSKELSELKTTSGMIFCFGNEGHGLSQKIQANSNLAIKININPHLDSLNVASTSAIIFYHLNRLCCKN